MERIFHIHQLTQLTKEPSVEPDAVRLHRGHLWLNPVVAQQAFGEERQVYLVYYPQRGSLLMAPMSNNDFKSLHTCSLVMLKDRNLKGDKSLSLQEILIDHDLDDADCSLEYKCEPGMELLQVFLHKVDMT